MAIGGADTEQPGQVEPTAGGGADTELSGQVEPTAVGGAGTVAAGRHRVRKEGGRNRVGISTHSPEANACQQPSEAEGSWQTQRKIGRRLRGARGATWLERSASLKAGAICAWIEGRDRVW